MKTAKMFLLRSLGRTSPGKIKNDIRKACRLTGVWYSSYKKDEPTILIRHHATVEELKGISRFILNTMGQEATS